jgi:type IV pilus assembly protein PilX
MNSCEVAAMNSMTRSLTEPKISHRQRGVVLVVSLIMLLVITLIAVGSTQGVVLEEKMAGNSSDRSLAFQAAESGLREAEIYIDGVVSLGDFDGSAGLYGLANPEPDYLLNSTWTAAAPNVSAQSTYGAYEAPRYFIKHFTTVTGMQGALNMSGYGDNRGTGDVSVFKITGRGTGGNADSAEVILRSHYGRIL